MVHLKLFKNLSERNRVNKNIQQLAELEGTFRGQCNVLSPVITIKGEFTNQCNYFYVEELDRYYYVVECLLISDELIQLTGAVDVLMSWAVEIKLNRGIISRQATNYNLYLQDPLIHAYQNAMIGTLEFPDGFVTESYILATLA